MVKTLKILVGTSLLLSLSTAIASPAKANPEVDHFQISQLLGHDRYDDQPQMNGDDYVMGRVVGKAGNILSIVLDDGTVINTAGSIPSGSNVLLTTTENGDYVVAEAAHPTWIYKLVEDYNVKPW